jgi:diguanylate cyclase (GGDEF)-like protein
LTARGDMISAMDARGSGPTLLEAARILARGGDLESELGALAGHVLRATGARAAAVYLLDPVGQSLVPAAAAGLGAMSLGEAGTVQVGDESELVGRVAQDRRPLTAGGEASSLLGATGPDGLIGVPLVTSDEAGQEDTEGVLLAAFAGQAPNPEVADDPLFALADLCAVAIRKARLAHALTERSEWIERLASTDALTGLPNRQTFERMLELEIARATRQGAQLSVVLLDVEGMGALNAREGQRSGDDVLRRLASLLADQVRLVDTIGRLGGDEFGVIAPGGGGEVVAGRVRDAASAMTTRGGTPMGLRTAVITYPDDGATSAELLAAADAALARAG